MNDTEYNGWTNYATWRVNLEIFDGYGYGIEPNETTAEHCEAFAKEIVVEEVGESLALDYALAFLRQVNWQEIADSINEYN